MKGQSSWSIVNCMNFREELERRVLVLDGAMGTEILRRRGEKPEFAEQLNLDEPELILSIHRDYVEAGADIIETNTFSLNLFRLRQLGLGESRLCDYIGKAVELARKAAGDKAFVAGSCGPSGKLAKPLGDAEVEEIFENYYKIARCFAKEGVDLIQFETMIDVFEASIAVRAAKEVADLPVLVSMTFTEGGRTVTGSDPETAYHILEASQADVLGANCGKEIEEFVGIAEALRRISSKPFAIYPNAGLPDIVNGKPVYRMKPEQFINFVEKFRQAGASILGGCCGTTPDFIRLIASRFKGAEPPSKGEGISYFFVASRSRLAKAGQGLAFMKVGERINPFGSKKAAAYLENRDLEGLGAMALSQQKAGADALDINLGRRGEEDPIFFAEAVEVLSSRTVLPFFMDVKNPSSLEEALRFFPGRAAINSCTAEDKAMEELLPLARKFSAAVVGICIDEDGIASTAKEKLRAAEKFVQRAMEEFGLRKSDIIMDPVVLTAGTGSEAVKETLKAIELIKKELGVATIVGLSNVSHGLPSRKHLNSAFLAMAIGAGLDAAIMNVESELLMATAAAAEVLAGRDPAARRYLSLFGPKLETLRTVSPAMTAAQEQAGDKRQQLYSAVLEGYSKRARQLTEELLKEGENPLEILNGILIPAMREVGKLYEERKYFLPQLVASSEAMKQAASVLEGKLKLEEKAGRKRKVLLATVQGDLHDIGKNIVKALFQNFGYEVVDLGKNVAPEQILEEVNRHRPDLVGLSCLMTTTLASMERTVRLLKEHFPDLPVIVGGATVTPAFQKKIGADAFGKDAVDGLKKAKKLLGEEE